ncbi:undecaprenyl-diphosphate phosphatase [Paenibacillus sp. MMS20-IR301]|uniref:undecaprenyl-diphosphate phosphatase n=1 Tax=Paenibacillus sp. MMS20-IR301 TaxID=2895946 RepID=UPI0028E7DBEC|nr:undecaprenyl-diphosphate phosphatase [Paenibacillus sp. MMS20-IR301]WNS45458.1 undecaprenyl-diphosphate phosphatase [Paenibacillus sp. MMS20-IR301]
MENWLDWLKYMLLGVVQGVTEPIPVSSSGHLIIVQRLLGMQQNGLSFEILTNTASLIAITFIFRNDIKALITGAFRYLQSRQAEYRPDFMFCMYIILGTIPAAAAAVLFKDSIERIFTSVHTVSISLLITGVALWLIRNLRGQKRDGNLTVRDAIIVGLAQAVALIPGISRSGSTVIASIAVGMKQDTALKFSFMLYIPISIGGLILGASDIANDPNRAQLALPYLIAFITTLVATYYAMRWFIGIMAKGNLIYFSYYCFAVSILLMIFL